MRQELVRGIVMLLTRDAVLVAGTLVSLLNYAQVVFSLATTAQLI